MPERTLRWAGCLNVRDLGGHRLDGGGETRFRAVVRADSVRQLSDHGWQALVDYGVRRIVDLRFPQEVAADPPRDLSVEAVHVSLLGDPDEPHLAEIDELHLSTEDPVARTAAVYLEFLERFRPNVGATVAAIARAPAGTVVVHCQGGKDRTGLIAALLLRLVGVGLPDIAEDYGLSASNLAPVLEQWIAAAQTDGERTRRRLISAGPAEAMIGVLEELERRYGSVAAYLRAAGATDEDLRRLRERLTG